jgi:hypothetical protein
MSTGHGLDAAQAGDKHLTEMTNEAVQRIARSGSDPAFVARATAAAIRNESKKK